MPTFKKYSGIKASEDFLQRCGLRYSVGDGYSYQVRQFKDTSGNIWEYLACGASGNQAATDNFNRNIQYLTADTIKASTDNYDLDDYNGTSTGTCQFNRSRQTGGISYQIQFTANESAEIKCFKFFKTLRVGAAAQGTNSNATVLMFAIYFDSPISVTSGQILNMSVNFAYDDQQVTII